MFGTDGTIKKAKLTRKIILEPPLISSFVVVQLHRKNSIDTVDAISG